METAAGECGRVYRHSGGRVHGGATGHAQSAGSWLWNTQRASWDMEFNSLTACGLGLELVCGSWTYWTSSGLPTWIQTTGGKTGSEESFLALQRLSVQSL